MGHGYINIYMEWMEDYCVITNIIGVLPILPGQGTRTDSDNLVNKLIDGSRMNRSNWRIVQWIVALIVGCLAF